MENSEPIEEQPQQPSQGMKSSTKTLLVATIVILVIIFVIMLIYQNNSAYVPDKEVIDCISGKAILYYSPTCSHCAEQEDILGEDLDSFILISSAENASLFKEKGIYQVPTWEVNGELYSGVKSWKNLKEITGC